MIKPSFQASSWEDVFPPPHAAVRSACRSPSARSVVVASPLLLVSPVARPSPGRCVGRGPILIFRLIYGGESVAQPTPAKRTTARKSPAAGGGGDTTRRRFRSPAPGAQSRATDRNRALREPAGVHRSSERC